MTTYRKLSPTAVLIPIMLTVTLALGFSHLALGQEDNQSREGVTKRSIAQHAIDKSITITIRNIFFADIQDQSNYRINVTTVNGIVLLLGEVPTAEMKDFLQKTAEELESVRQVVNEVRVGKVSKTSKLIKDQYLKASVNFRIGRAKSIPSSDIVVIVSNTIAYLMGVLTEEEAKIAADIAAKTRGIERVVSIFEIFTG